MTDVATQPATMRPTVSNESKRLRRARVFSSMIGAYLPAVEVLFVEETSNGRVWRIATTAIELNVCFNLDCPFASIWIHFCVSQHQHQRSRSELHHSLLLTLEIKIRNEDPPSSPRLWGSWISPSKKERERRRKGEKRGKKKIRKNKREGLVHPSKSSKLKILTMSKVPEVAVERKSSAGHNVSLSRRMLLPMDDLDSLTLPL